MIEFILNTVHQGWEDVANPDDLDVTLKLDRTKHDFYPSLRELVLLYDAVVNEREAEFVIGTADFVEITNEDVGAITINLPPICVTVDRESFVASLEDLLGSVFICKDNMGNQDERQKGINLVQSWITSQGGQTDVRNLYQSIVDGE